MFLDVFEAEHFVRCETKNACYENDPVTGRHSVIVPYENPPGNYELFIIIIIIKITYILLQIVFLRFWTLFVFQKVF